MSRSDIPHYEGTNYAGSPDDVYFGAMEGSWTPRTEAVEAAEADLPGFPSGNTENTKIDDSNNSEQ